MALHFSNAIRDFSTPHSYSRVMFTFFLIANKLSTSRESTIFLVLPESVSADTQENRQILNLNHKFRIFICFA